MRRLARAMSLALVMSVLTAIALPVAANAALSGATCTDFLSPGRYGHVVVPEGASCFSDGGVTIRGGLEIEPGATFVLGSEENPGDNGTISGGVTADDPSNVQIHFMTINGGIDIDGGSGPFGPPFDVNWIAIEDNAIHGAVEIDGYDGFWFGFIRNHVAGTVTLTNNVLEDPDANEYVTNVIRGNLNCSGNDPAPQVGDSEGEPNVVSGNKTGQCADL